MLMARVLKFNCVNSKNKIFECTVIFCAERMENGKN